MANVRVCATIHTSVCVYSSLSAASREIESAICVIGSSSRITRKQRYRKYQRRTFFVLGGQLEVVLLKRISTTKLSHIPHVHLHLINLVIHNEVLSITGKLEEKIGRFEEIA